MYGMEQTGMDTLNQQLTYIYLHLHQATVCTEAMLRPNLVASNSGDVRGQNRYRHSTVEQNRLRTEKARAQRLLASQRKFEKERQDLESNHSVLTSISGDADSRTTQGVHLQRYFFTKSFFHAQYQEDAYSGNRKAFAQDRARSVLSLIRAIASLFGRIFAPPSPTPTVHHVINTHIVDDTSTRMRGPSHNDPATIFTIMNSIQDVHIRYDDADSTGDNCEGGQLVSFRIPTPLIVLEDASGKGIFEAFMAFAAISSKGVGSMLQRYGVQQDIIQSKWKCFVFIGDSLKANQSAFRQEAAQVIKHADAKHLCLNFRRLVHQIALIRKPVVLSIPRLWSTLVRLSHLFEVVSFRKAFARALASVITSSFTYIPISENLPQAAEWESVRKRLQANFRCKSKCRMRNLEALLAFVNGDPASDCVFHYCIQTPPGEEPCCTGREHALAKCLRHLVPFLARGFPVPLLYRFKHYDEAVSYMTFGLTMHSLLTRTMNSMQHLGSATVPKQDFIDQLLTEVDVTSEGFDGTDPASLVDDLHENFAAQNAKRKQLVCDEIVKDGFQTGLVILDFIIHPMDAMMNRLLKRNELVTRMTLLSTFDANFPNHAAKSKQLFLSVASGAFGWSVIQEYCKMINGGLDTFVDPRFNTSDQKHLQSVFKMILQIISNIWRRFVHDHNVGKFKMFSLIETSLEEFVMLWDALQIENGSCCHCFDTTFSKRVLNIYPGQLAESPRELQQAIQKEVTILLSDLVTHCPISSDPVEVKNGQVQNISCRRGNQAIKTPLAAKEASFLQSVIRGYELVKHYIEGETLPSPKSVAGILRQTGVKGRNQYSKTSGRKAPFT